MLKIAICDDEVHQRIAAIKTGNEFVLSRCTDG